MSFSGMNRDPGVTKTRLADCTCLTCKRHIHHLGIMSHRAAHRRRKEDCTIVFTDGRTVAYSFSRIKEPRNDP